MLQPLIVGVEERFPSYDRPAESPAKLIQQKGIGRRSVEWRARVEHIVAEEIEGLAVKNVCPRGGNHRYLPARRSILRIGAEILRLHLKFLDRIQRNIQAHVLTLFLIVNSGRIHAIERQIVVVEAVTGEAVERRRRYRSRRGQAM